MRLCKLACRKAKKEDRARRDDSDAEPAELGNQKERAKVVQVEFQSMLKERPRYRYLSRS